MALVFAFDAPKVWNDLPNHVCGTSSVAVFGRKLKTYLFAKAYPPEPHCHLAHRWEGLCFAQWTQNSQEYSFCLIVY